MRNYFANAAVSLKMGLSLINFIKILIKPLFSILADYSNSVLDLYFFHRLIAPLGDDRLYK